MMTLSNRIVKAIHILIYLGIGWMLVMMLSCSNESQHVATDATNIEEPSNKKAGEMIDNLPSPVEMAILVKHSGAKYNAAHLNDLQALPKYLTNDKKSLNLGVYSADIGYTSLFKQTQETMFYLDNLRKLSDGIGLSEAFDQSVFDRIEANLDNRDSLLSIISEAYQVANGYLKDNDRYSTAVLIIAGAWAESLHLAISLCQDETSGINKDIALRIDQQRATLARLLESMEEFKGDNQSVDTLLGEFKELQKIYDEKPIATSDKDENITVDEAQLMAVSQKSDEIRNWMIN